MFAHLKDTVHGIPSEGRFLHEGECLNKAKFMQVNHNSIHEMFTRAAVRKSSTPKSKEKKSSHMSQTGHVYRFFGLVWKTENIPVWFPFFESIPACFH